jgi:hypothetical protein
VEGEERRGEDDWRGRIVDRQKNVRGQSMISERRRRRRRRRRMNE